MDDIRWRPSVNSCVVSLNGILFQATPANMLTFKKLRRVLLVTSLLFCGAYLYFVVPTFHSNLVEPPVPLDAKGPVELPQEVAPPNRNLKIRSGVVKSNEERDQIKEQDQESAFKKNPERPWFFQHGVKRPLPGERGWYKSFKIYTSGYACFPHGFSVWNAFQAESRDDSEADSCTSSF